MKKMIKKLAGSLTAENRFILAAARVNPDAGAVDAAARNVQDWNGVYAVSKRQHLAGLVASASTASAFVPQAIKDRLTAEWNSVRARNVIYLFEAREALTALTAAGLNPIVLKGVALTETIYKDPGLRPFGDMDLLFPLPQIDEAQRIVESIGYRASATPHNRQWYFEHYYHLPPFGVKRGSLSIELHWDLGRRPHPFDLDFPGIRARAVKFSVEGVDALMMGPEDMLCHLALHSGWGNGFDGHIRSIVDIAEVARRGIDWELLTRLVIEQKLGPIVTPALELAAWLFEAPIPDAVFNKLEPHRGGRLCRWVVGIGQDRVLKGGTGHRTAMRLLWLENNHDRVTLLRENFGSVENPQNDRREGKNSLARLVIGVRRALVPLLGSFSKRD
ncbi:MAG: nucleotidyltransferase family protein [Candidatus Eremiobacteraeota bacterium]|nr:nucleotidyltransferase family protein [Candidatus Eremiobacteraeota bacterium]